LVRIKWGQRRAEHTVQGGEPEQLFGGALQVLEETFLSRQKGAEQVNEALALLRLHSNSE
jgi:hypothetical protein